MHVRSRSVLVAALLAAAAPAAQAQLAAPADAPAAAPAPATPAVGPSLALTSDAVRAQRPALSREASLHSMAAARTGRGETLMIVGGAALIAGLVIGKDAGTLIAVGGAVVGLYGLYIYLDQGQ